ncbi:MAG: UDP-N-acetylglucosamine--N-acetylmuramyl-(pentapeptide) pyrophosphoryl-undecaprenol N-acetylglucosamine transferase [candidate division WOR-3 bacterium]|nr:MAG: UDP-N-acetylglucosamine--N-acetylmuramyl-(pentapeptide) pyrophosphoryl-undecaprenol N-acetylglucosamine transferase [candidate division WOR-3 bacterium]
MNNKYQKVIISGVGTGGHYFPAAVVARELFKRDIEVLFLVRRGYHEEKVARHYGLNIFYIKIHPFYGKSVFRKMIFIVSLLYSIYKLHSVTKDALGLTFGGFGSLPVIISCLLHRRPLYMFEPNRIPGRATKMFFSKARKVFLGLPLMTVPKGNSMVTGIPIREDFKHISKPYAKLVQRKRILFYGGSQGAQKLNNLAVELQAILPQEYEIVIISGERDYEWVYSKRNGRTRVIPFTLSPWDEIENADIIVSRSGALAGYEILSSNRPVIFIPFPFAVDNHQYYNAEFFTRIGNAVVIRERDVTGNLIAEKIIDLIKRDVQKKACITFDAEQRIADMILREM